MLLFVQVPVPENTMVVVPVVVTKLTLTPRLAVFIVLPFKVVVPVPLRLSVPLRLRLLKIVNVIFAPVSVILFQDIPFVLNVVVVSTFNTEPVVTTVPAVYVINPR